MRTLIIPDIHNKIAKVKDLLGRVEYDQTVCLGDWFDNWNDTPDDARRTAEYLIEFLEDPKHLTLIGNHDLPYITGDDRDHCSGFTVEKFAAIRSVIPKHRWSDWLNTKSLRIQIVLGNSILTHAGWDQYWSQADASEGISYFFGIGNRPEWFNAGRDRGGILPVGGPFWVDFRSLDPYDFQDGLYQIVGHTQNRNVRLKNGAICLDTSLRHYAILEDGKLTVYTWQGEVLPENEIDYLG